MSHALHDLSALAVTTMFSSRFSTSVSMAVACASEMETHFTSRVCLLKRHMRSVPSNPVDTNSFWDTNAQRRTHDR